MRYFVTGCAGFIGSHLTERLLARGHEVVGYDMAQPNPVEIKRFATVQNPYSLGLDSTSGRLYVAGVTGGVLQILDTAS